MGNAGKLQLSVFFASMIAVLFIIISVNIATAEEPPADPCAGIVCNPTETTCPDGFKATCSNSCSNGACSSCTPDCSGHQVVDKCAGVNCDSFTQKLTCPDTFVASCTPSCDPLTGTCGTCNPDCSDHQSAGGPSCGNGKCESGEDSNNCMSDCPRQCPTITAPGPDFCKDGRIEKKIDNNGCIAEYECIKGPSTAICGNRICEPGETAENCHDDCGKPACIQVITPAVNPYSGDCKEFSTPCEVPYDWKKVASCKDIGGGYGRTCPLYSEPPCQNGYKVSAGSDANGCALPITCCGDKICSGKENSMNCESDCTGAQNCANVVVCMSGDGCCPSGCSASQDKDCGGQLPTAQKCPDGSIVKCGYRGENYICDPCPIPKQEGCHEESDPSTGIVRMVCNKICPEQQEVINNQMSAAKQKCIAYNGTAVSRVDGRGCNYIDCEFRTAIASPISITNVYCPSPQQIDDTIAKCKSLGIEPLFSFENNCKVVKCAEQKKEDCMYKSEQEWERMKSECNPKGLLVIKEFDKNGCQILRCAYEGECQRDPPPEAFEKCKQEGGEMIIKRDQNGCAFSKCIMRGDERDVYVEDITNMPDSSELLSIAFKLENLKMELDKLVKKTDDLANYYKSKGSTDENRFRRVSSMFMAAEDKVEEIKTKLRNRLNELKKDDIMEIKKDIRYIKDVTLKDIVYVMLSNSDEVKSMIQTPVTTTENKEDCGTDGMCFDKAFRMCKPVKFSPKDTSDESPDIYIIGLEGDKCIIKIMMPEGKGPPAGMIPGVNPPYEMKCKMPNYALGAQQFGGGEEVFKKYCEGNLLKLMELKPPEKQTQPTKGQIAEPQQPIQSVPIQTGGGSGQSVPAGYSGPCQGCLNNGICDVGECKDCKDCYGR